MAMHEGISGLCIEYYLSAGFDGHRSFDGSVPAGTIATKLTSRLSQAAKSPRARGLFYFTDDRDILE